MLCLIYNHIVYGTCELKDYPEGEPPHHWQFERTPVRQWWAKHFGESDIEHHERNLAYYEKIGIQARWRSSSNCCIKCASVVIEKLLHLTLVHVSWQIEQRVKHLEGERWDYKAWSYQPVSTAWVDYGRWHALRLRDQHGCRDVARRIQRSLLEE
ncbi:hypothetical protein TELCIR_03717 [Teladorsagia circumcincta]|uniref:NADH dehydrogenase [ubiquinone] 1 beta subcomplex subunit 5, mitochondrial n=1 Tax=Teladorsagia circumcincta TaxID=45464 RepID=A0A2G9UVJ2_TELCI|nr:hypothetical protein TELCIR_03717 [Teladorsagia circumcincta]